MKPFALFFHRLKLEMTELEYPHLLIKNDEKKKLALYPGIILKCKDLGLEKIKKRFQLLLGLSQWVKG